MINTLKKYNLLFIGFTALSLSFPSHSFAADLKVSGWIPYWRTENGIKDAKENLDSIDTVHPFGYGVESDGKLNDMSKLKTRQWTKFLKSAKSEHVEIIPTVMWSDGAAIHKMLSDESLRKNHIEEIGKVVRKNKFDGIDIDYEAKRVETIDYFSMFLKELKSELGTKTLSCTIEARTPPDSLYTTMPTKIEYANDYKEIAKYCDRVNIMAYDQRRADIKLNKERIGVPYVPVSDVEWVRKVLELTVKTIPAEKIMLAVPTYGHEYEVTVAPQWYKDYKRLWALNPEYAIDTAEAVNATAGRDKAGEMTYTYFATTSPFTILNGLPTPDGTPKGFEAAAKALMFANLSGMNVPVNIVTWSDAGSIAEKIKLANQFNLRGISIFKIDGAEDEEIWDLLK